MTLRFGNLLMIKRVFDIVVASSLLLLLSPFLFFFTLSIGITGSPIFFKQVRVGRFGEKFYIYKFRSMLPNAEEYLQELLAKDIELKNEWMQYQKLENDPRITKIGKFLRKTNIDELPQLYNVLIGDMSLVGPRPILYDELIRYGDKVLKYIQVRPGITGLWQVNRQKSESYSVRIDYDMQYISNQSLILDLRILTKTFFLMFTEKLYKIK